MNDLTKDLGKYIVSWQMSKENINTEEDLAPERSYEEIHHSIRSFSPGYDPTNYQKTDLIESFRNFKCKNNFNYN